MKQYIAAFFLLLCLAHPAHAIILGGGPNPIILTLTEFALDRIFQRVGTAKTITFAGTYAGVAPSQIDIQAIDAGSSAVVVAWTALGSPTISGGSFSGTVSIPQYDGWMKWQARVHSNPSGSLVTSVRQFGVGALILLSGQSNMAQSWIKNSGSPPASNANTRRYAGNGWYPVSDSWHTGEVLGNDGDSPPGTEGGDANISLANDMHTLLGVTVGVLNYAVGSTTSSQWASGGTYYNQTFGSGAGTPRGIDYADVGSDAELDLHAQGESDAENPFFPGGYPANLTSFYTGLKSHTRSSIALGFQLMGRSTRDGIYDTNWTTVRDDQLAFIAANGPNVYISATAMDTAIDSGGVHYSIANYQTIANRHTASYGNYLGTLSYSAIGPQLTAAHWSSGTPTVVTVNISPTATFLLQDGAGGTTGTSLNGFQVLDNLTTVNTTASSNSSTVGSCTGISAGQFIWSHYFLGGTTVTSCTGTTLVTNTNATTTATGTELDISYVVSSTAFSGSPISKVILTLAASLPSGDVGSGLVGVTYECCSNPHGDFGGPPSTPTLSKYVFDTSTPNGISGGLPMESTNNVVTVVTP